jgi:hypothetical protein
MTIRVRVRVSPVQSGPVSGVVVVVVVVVVLVVVVVEVRDGARKKKRF